MHDDLKSFKQKPTQNFHKISKILKNPKVYQKSQRVGQKEWNAW